MDKVIIVVTNSRWFEGELFMEPIVALPILSAELQDNFDYEILDCNGENLTEEECAKK